MSNRNRSRRIRQRRQFLHQIDQVPFRHRVDIMWMIGILGTIIGLVGLAGILVQLGDLRGYFDPETIEQIPDERILENVYDDTDTVDFLDAVYHTDNHLYVSQEGGNVYRFDPRTRLWDTETPSFADGMIGTDFQLLRSGCGIAHDSDLVDWLDDCDDPESLWAVESNGGLVRRVNGEWEVLVSTTSFLGLNGEPVEQDELTSAAVSADGQYLILGTRSNGLGLYHIQHREWISIAGNQDLPQEIEQIVEWRGYFWVASPQTLTRFAVVDERVTGIREIEAIDGDILDLDADSALWILTENQCTGDGRCLWFGMFDDVNDDPRPVIDQRNHFPELSINRLHFAQQVSDRLTVAGEYGIYTYDVATHSWTRAFAENAELVLPFADKTGFYFTSSEGVGLIIDGRLQGLKQDISEPIRHLFYEDPQNESGLLALTENGHLYRVNVASEAPSRKVFDTQVTDHDPLQFKVVIDLGDTLFFGGSEGALLHNVRTRSYETISAGNLPSWASNSESVTYRIGNTVFVIAPPVGDAPATIHRIPIGDLRSSAEIEDKKLLLTDQTPLPTGELIDSWRWGDIGIGVKIDEQIYFVGDDLILAAGSPAPSSLSSVRDVAELDFDLVVALQSELLVYEATSRAWGSLSVPDFETPNATIAEIATIGNELYLRSSDSRLTLADGASKIGSISPFSIADNTLSDAWATGTDLYLGGNGRVDRYSLTLRKITGSWTSNQGGVVVLTDIINDIPVYTTNNNLFWGNDRLSTGSDAVLSTSLDNNFIWTVRQTTNHRYLHGFPRNNPTNQNNHKCYFRRPSASGTEVLDARQITDSEAVVATDQGMYLYSSQSRSWYPLLTNSGFVPNRLYKSGPLLVLLDEANSRFATAPLGQINAPASCANQNGTWRVNDLQPIIDLTVNENSGQIAWITPEGVVEVWQNGQPTTRLRNTIQPDTVSFQNFFDRSTQGHLLFTQDNLIYYYDLGQQYWRAIPVSTSSGAVPLNLNIEWTGDKNIVSATDLNGTLYLGDLESDTTDLVLEAIFTNPTADELFNADGGQILDVQLRGSDNQIWTFVLDTGIKYYDSEARTWQNGPVFAADQTFDFVRAANRGVLVGNNGQRFYIANQMGNHPNRFTPYDRTASDQTEVLDGQGQIWRLGFDNTVQRCTPSGDNYQCQTEYTPLVLDPTRLNHGFIWQEHAILSGESLEIIDLDSVTRRPITPPPLPVGNVTASSIIDGNALLFDEVAGRITMIDADFNFEQFDNATRLHFDTDQRAWAEINGSWFYFDTDWQAVGDSLSVFFPHDSTPTAVDEIGQLYLWQDDRFVPATPVLEDEDSSLIDFIIEDNGEWWIALGPDFLHIITTTIAAKQTLPIGSITTGESTDDGVAFLYESGTRLDIEINPSGSYTTTSSTDLSLLPQLPSINRWPQIRNENILELQNGGFAYDPVTDLQILNGQLFAIRDSSRQSVFLAESGIATDEFSAVSPLDVTWLRWNRVDQSFTVAVGNNSTQTISRNDFEADGHLLFETADAVFEQDWVYIANEHGVWRYGGRGLGLNDPSIRYFPQPIGAVRAIKSSFLTNGRQLPLSNGFVNEAIQNRTVQIGDVVFNEDLQAQTIAVSFFRDGRSVPAQTNRGFLWDSGRRGLAWSGTELMILTDAGIHQTNQLIGFNGGPSSDVSQLNIDGNGLGDLYANTAGRWDLWNGADWQLGVADPHANRVMIDNQIWRWEIQQGVVQVDLVGDEYQYQFSVDPLNFTFDQLRSGGAVNGQLVVATDAFVEIGTENNGYLDQLQASRSPVIETDIFFTRRLASDRTTISLFNQTGSGLRVWDGAQFTPYAGPDPRQTRPLVDGNRLRMELVNGQFIKEMARENVTGDLFWSEFEFVNGRFPFDLVYAVSAVGDNLLIGTEAGLQIYPRGVIKEVDQIPAFYDLGGPVVRSGIPERDPSLMVVLTSNNCFTWRSGAPPVECDTAIPLAERIRVSNQFWYWTVSSANAVSGRYRLQDGSLSNNPINLAGNRFPHDQIADVVVCQNVTYTIWDEDWISQHGTLTLQIEDSIENYDLTDATPLRLICLEEPVPLPRNQELEPGVYYEGDDNVIWQAQGSQWLPLEENLIAPFVAYVNNRPEWQLGRLQVQDNGEDGSFVFERRALNNEWEALPWIDNERLGGWQVGIDRWHNLILLDDQLWASTANGLITVSLLPNSNKIQLLPNSFLAVPLPAPLCIATDIKPVADAGGTEIALRCQADSAQVYHGNLNQLQDRDLFSLQSQDPFVELSLISNPLWDWHLTGREQGSLGQLVAERSDEAVGLSDGVFDFDTINSAAFFFEGTIELATDRAGWFQIPRSSAHLAEYDRFSGVRDTETVQGVSITRSDEARYLCLHRDGRFQRVSINSEVESPPTCPQYLGHDRLWQYGLDGSTTPPTLPINALHAIGGEGERELRDGRFTDDIVTGAPLPFLPENEQLRYYLPTEAGIVELDDEFLATAIHTPPFADLRPIDVPKSLILFNGLPTFAGRQGLFYLDGREKIETVEMPEASSLYDSIEYGHNRYLRLEDGAEWTLVDRQDKIVLRNALPIDDANDFAIFEQNRTVWTAQGEPSLLFQFQDVSFTPSITVSFGSNTPLESAHFHDYELVEPILIDEELLLIGKEDLLKLDLPSVMVESFPEDGQVQATLVNTYTVAFGELVDSPPIGYRACAAHVDSELQTLSPDARLGNLALFTIVLSQVFLQAGEGGEAQTEAAIYYGEQAYALSRELGTPNPDVELQVLNFLVGNYMQLGALGAAEAALGAARELAASMDSDEGAASLGRFELILPLSRGKIEDVERIGFETIAIYESSENFAEVANTRLILSQIYFDTGRFEEALRQSQESVFAEKAALAQAKTLELPEAELAKLIKEKETGLLHANFRLSLTYLGLAQYDEAYQIVIDEIEPNLHLLTEDIEAQGNVGRLSLASIYTGMANAIASVEPDQQQLASDQFLRAHETLNQGIALLEQAYASDTNADSADTSQANPCEQALSIEPHEDLLRSQLANAYTSQARFYLAQPTQDFTRAQASFENALLYSSEITTFRDLTPIVHLEIAHANLTNKQVGNIDVARESAEIADMADLAIGSATLGVIKEDVDNDTEAAIALYQKAIQGWEMTRDNIQAEGLQIDAAEALFDLSDDMYGRLISLLIEQANLTQDYSLLTDAFEYSERARARSFLDQFAQVTSVEAADIDPDLAVLLDELNNVAAEIRSDSDNREPIQNLEAEQNRLVDQIKVLDPEIASMVAVVPPSFSEIQQTVPEDVTLLQYVITDYETWAFVINGPTDPLKVVPLGVNKVSARNIAGDVMMDGSSNNIPTENLEIAYQTFIAPLREHIDSEHKKIIIVPHLNLHRMPWSALVDPGNGEFLSEQYLLTFLPSSSTLTYLAAKPPKQPTNEALVLGVRRPSYGGSTTLDHAESEAISIATILNTNPLIGPEASQKTIQEQAESSRILHISAHGEYMNNYPQLSNLQLYDEPLEIYDIYNLNLETYTDLVVLSACDAGIGNETNSDDIISLNRAFMQAGASNVIATLWPVEQKNAELFMLHFYARVDEGYSYSEALQMAQQHMRESPDTAAPYYWAGYVLTGGHEPSTYQATLNFINNNFWFTLFITTMTLVIIGSIIFVVRSRQQYQ